MKKTTLFLALFLSSHLLFSQFVTSGTYIYSPTTATVGIGVGAPASKLTVAGGVRIDDAGAFTVPLSPLATTPWLSFGNYTTGEGIASQRNSGGTNQYGLDFYTNSLIRACITSHGNLLVGKTTQTNFGYRLDVGGTARIDKIVVNTTGADFVFDSAYRLPPLSFVASYIKNNHHLPGIEAAADMQKNGLDVGGNQTLLLQKVEELTLYLLEMKKENEALKNRLEQLETSIGK